MNKVQIFVATLQKLTPLVEKKLHKVISPEQAMCALCIDLEKTLEEAASISWDEETLALALECCKSIVELPEVLAIAEFEFGIVPEGVEHWILEELVKHKGEQWFIHKHDADPFPSNPHAHNYQKGLKLHLGTGEFYFGKKIVGSLPAKSFMELRDKVKHIDLPPIQV